LVSSAKLLYVGPGWELSTSQSTGDTMQLGVRAGLVHTNYGSTQGWQVELCHPSLTHAVPKQFSDESDLVIKCYTNLLYFTVEHTVN